MVAITEEHISSDTEVDEIRVLIPCGCLGYHYDPDLFQAALNHNPDVIAVDSGSVDPGPYYLGHGVSFVSRDATKTDLRPLVNAACTKGIPLIVTTAGGAGGRKHLTWMAEIVREIASEDNLAFPMALIDSEVDKDYLLARLESERITGLGHDNDLTAEDVERCSAITAQIGYEPVVEALKGGAQVIIVGRAVDDVAIAAYPIFRGLPKEYALPAGKVTECGASCLDGMRRRVRGGSVPVFAVIRRDGFLVEPTPEATETVATVRSIADHMMYEERDPLMVVIPGGTENSTEAKLHQLDDRTVFITGNTFDHDPVYRVKLEGSAFAGYRCVVVGGIRSREMIEQIDEIIAEIREMVERHYKHVDSDSYQLFFRVYGRDGVMGDLEPNRDVVPHEVGIVAEVIAPTQDLADSICHYATGTYLHHMWYPGSRSDCCGNFAVAFSPLEIGKEPAYEWAIHHLMTLDDPLEIVDIRHEFVGSK